MRTLFQFILPVLVVLWIWYEIAYFLYRRKKESIEKNQNPRLVAAQKLLLELKESDREEVVVAAEQLETSLRSSFEHLQSTKETLQTYQEMGESVEGQKKLIEQQERNIQELFTGVKELHFMVNNDQEAQQSVPKSVSELLLHLKAENEVDRL